MTFSIIGTGNIAWFFGTRLVTSRHNCRGVYSRNEAAAKSMAEALLSDKYGTIGDIKDGEADVCFLAISDNAIAEVAAKLAFKNTILVHTAGSVSIDVLDKAAKEQAILWPVYSILKNNMPGHRNIPCGWEANTDKAKKYVLAMAHAITDILFEARYEQRKWLHLSAVMSNNFVTHLLAIGEKVCLENQLPYSTLQPIIEQTFERLRNFSPQSVQTGPAMRNDTSTIDEQIALLEDHPQWKRVYEAITESIQSSNRK
jgi:predicted short-subunit dehydrogenase-like oxidoreductase (DUF2520 family)